MNFKIKSPYNIDNTPIYFVKEEDGVLGRTNMNCSITISDKVKDPKQIKEIVDHEKVHVKQIKDGRLAYDDKTFTIERMVKVNGKLKKEVKKWMVLQ